MLFFTTDPTKWGDGVNRRLTPSEVDGNFWELRKAINDILANPPEPKEIISITASGNTITFHLSDGSDIGPVFMPVLQFHWRADWEATASYFVLDIFRVNGVGLYSVLIDHTSPSAFNENYTDPTTGEPVYYKLFGFNTTETIGSLTDVAISSPTNKQIIEYHSSDGKWHNVDPPAGDLAHLNDVTLTSLADKQIIHWDAGSSKWINAAPAPTALAALTDVAIASPADGQIVRYNASASKWENVALPPAPIYAPLVTGELPGPVAIADGRGQFIMVPI